MTNRVFYMIHCTGGNAPTFRHPSIEGATAEAERLARQNPGKEFVVLKSIASAVKQDVQWNKIEDDCCGGDDCCIPF